MIHEKLCVSYMYLYFIASILVIYIVGFMYFRIKHPFWSIQPVFHMHNLRYWCIPPGIINHGTFPMTKYYDPLCVDVKPFDQLSDYQIQSFIQLIKRHYLREKELVYNPTKTNVLSHFNQHNHNCYYSAYYTNEPIYDASSKKFIHKRSELGSLTSRPLHVSLFNNEMICHYVDYLCVKETSRKKNVAPKIIYTYALEISKKQKESPVFLFKREGESTAIVPLVTYNVFTFDNTYWKSNVRFPEPYKLTRINGSNASLLFRVIDQCKSKFDCFIMSNISNIEHLIQENVLQPYIIHNKDDIVAVYFMKETCVTFNNEGSIDCIGSILLQEEFIEFFELGFMEIVCQRKREDNNKERYINIENISHNHKFLGALMNRFTPIYYVPNAYYFYNFAIRPVLKENVCILC